MRRTTLHESLDDAKVKKAVKDAMLYDPRVFSFNTDVEVANGIVTLSGIVDNLKAKKAAAQNARNTIGVWRVKNHLRVRPKMVPANDILEKRVADAFQNDPYIDRYDIKISAFNGSIYLNGIVMNSFEKNRAEEVAEGVKGVVYIYNNLDYKHEWTWKPDWAIVEDVNEQLFWSPFVDSDQISVAVENGVVTLSGKVDTLSEKEAAQYNAYQGGAKEVNNKLDVKVQIGGPSAYGQYYQFQYPYFAPLIQAYPPLY
jgi:osmotically-inducible protein OsmY